MPDPQFRVAEIEVSRSTVDEKILGIFRYDSESHTRSNHYTILVLAEIVSTLYAYEQLLDTINSTIEQVRHLVAGVDADPVARFEKLTGKLNEAIAAFGEREPTPITWSRINLFVLQLCDGHLCLSGIGHLTNLFLQKQKEDDYRAFDLLGSLEQPAEVDPKKPFASLICGDMHPGDVLFAGTTNFQRQLPQLDLETRLTTLPPVTAAMEIKQILEASEVPDDYAAVIVAGVQLAAPASVPASKPEAVTKPRSTESVERLKQEEDIADAMLSPSIAPLSRNMEERDAEDDAIAVPPTPPLVAIMNIWTGVRESVGRLIPRRSDTEPITATSLRGMSAGHGTFFSRKRKLQLIMAGAALLIVIGGGIWFYQQRKFSGEQTLWNAAYDAATQKRTQAEADLVYGNEDQAQQLVTEAEQIANGLDARTADRKRGKEDLLKSLQDFHAKFRHEVSVAQPDVTYALTDTSAGQTVGVLAYYHDRLYAVDDGQHALMQIDPATKQTASFPLPSTTTVLYAGSSKDAFFMVTDQKGLLGFDPAHARLTRIPLTMTKATSTRAIAVYGKRLYLLDPLENMIWKYGSASSGYGMETAYLKSNTHPLGDATSIAVDSNVYVAFASGAVIRYMSGAEESWQLNAIDPPLAQAASVWTTPDTDRIVLADAASNRILVFKKDGHLISQIISPDMKRLTAVTGDDKNKKIYAADGGRVLSFDLP